MNSQEVRKEKWQAIANFVTSLLNLASGLIGIAIGYIVLFR